MRRRDFIKRLPLAAGSAFTLSGVPVRLFGKTSEVNRIAELSSNDRVLVILQLHGGNDGLNTLVPVEQYDLYYSRRANVAIPAKDSVRKYIPLDQTLPSEDQVGLHPDLIDTKALYDEGKVKVVQGVSYKNNNGSHFRGRDIRFMGGGADDYFSSGWIGRYLQNGILPQSYPEDFPNEQMPDPLALEMGSDVSLIFHQEGNIPASISLGSNPESFANLVESLEGFKDEGIDPRGKPPAFLQGSPYWNEMNWILNLEDKSEDYAARLLEVYQSGAEGSVIYPETYPFNAPKGSLKNPLSAQLKLVARLLDGGGSGQGVKTKVFLLKLGGFDTHADQVEPYDPTMGTHAALIYHISSAMRAFQMDLKARGLEDRVLTITTSEFGRRIASNGSFGTDHGTGGPVLIFGKHVSPGMSGTNPDLNKDNVEMQFDYRQLYATILKDWFEVDRQTIEGDVFYGNFIDGPDEDGGYYEALDIVDTNKVTGVGDYFDERWYLEDCYPNPAVSHTTLSYFLNGRVEVHLGVYDSTGKLLKVLQKGIKEPGKHKVGLDVSTLRSGIYYVKISAGLLRTAKKLIVKR